MTVLLTFGEFCQAVQWGGFTPRQPSPKLYYGLIQSLQSGLGRISCRLELAMFLGNILHETDGFIGLQEEEENNLHQPKDEPWMNWNAPLYFWEKHVHHATVTGDFEYVIDVINAITNAQFVDGEEKYDRQHRRDLYAHVRIVLGI